MVQDFCRQLQEFLTAHGIPDWLVVFIISVCPILECRLGMFTAIVLLEMNPFVGFIISFLGNILPIPFIAFDKLDFQGAEKSAGNKQGNILA